MIQFSLDTSTFINQLILVLVIALLPFLLWLLLSGKSGAFSGRTIIKMVLNVLLWFSVLSFIMQPYRQKKSSSLIGIMAGKDVPASFLKSLRDSLKNAELLDLTNTEDLSGPDRFDTLVITGQDFEPKVFHVLNQSERQPVLKWIPYAALDQLENLRWKGILRNGEVQTISGKIKSSRNQTLLIRFGNQTLDSSLLQKGENVFSLKFPVFTQGRTSVELALDNKTIDTIRFFARRPEPLTIQFLLENPDFETRTLATWLGKNGHAVLYNAKLSKDVTNKVNINKAKEPKLIITGPSNASLAALKKAVANGTSVLFMELTNTGDDVQNVNKAFQTRFQLKKVSAEAEILVVPGLTALPFQFVQNNYQTQVDNFPVSVEKTNGKIGMSLLNETFPLMLNGDSARYSEVWNAILANVRPATNLNLEIRAPVYMDLKNSISVNNFKHLPKFLKAGNDTLFLNPSAINSLSGKSDFVPTEPGWISLNDSTDTQFFVEKTHSGPLEDIFKMKNFVRSYEVLLDKGSASTAIGSAVSDKNMKQRPSDWLWFGLILFFLAAVWVEGKL